MPACAARARISPAVMKLSCPTNSPGAYADTRARCSARSNGARSSCLMAVLASAPSAPDLAAAGAGKVRRRASVRINVSPRRTHDLGGAVRASQAGPATGLIAQVLLLAVLAGTAGLGAAGWVVGVACAVTMAAALARGLARRRGPAGAGVVVDARARHARRRRRRAGRGLVRARHAGRAARDARRRRARAGRGRRMDGAAHRDGDRAGRALRRRGRRVPDPRPQRLRRPRGTARGCSRSGRRATCSAPASGCCRGCARRCRRAAGARSSRRRRGSC